MLRPSFSDDQWSSLRFACRSQQLLRVIQRAVGDLFAADDTRELVDPAVLIQRINAGEGAVVMHALADEQVIICA